MVEEKSSSLFVKKAELRGQVNNVLKVLEQAETLKEVEQLRPIVDMLERKAKNLRKDYNSEIKTWKPKTWARWLRGHRIIKDAVDSCLGDLMCQSCSYSDACEKARGF